MTILSGATLTVYGIYNIYKNITVNSGGSIVVKPGAQLKFYNGASLNVNGTLAAQGISTNKITFDFVAQNYSSQNGIKINQGSTGTFNYTIIKNAYRGIYINNNYASIQNSQFSNCSYGVYLYNTNYASTEPIIKNNTFTASGSSGIYCYYSSPNIVGNEITSYSTGVYCNSLSSPNLGYSNVYGNNKIHNNTNGLYVIVYSNPFLGRDACEAYGGSNSIYSNSTYNIRADIVCNIVAEKNWWGADPPDGNKIVAYDGSTIDYNPWLHSNPNLSLVNMSNSPEDIIYDNTFPSDTSNKEMGNTSFVTDTITNPILDNMYNYDENWPIKWKLLFARRLIEIGKYSSAMYACKDVILNNPDSTLSYYALDLLWKATNATKDISSFKICLGNIISSNKSKSIAGIADLILTGYTNTIKSTELKNILTAYNDKNIVQAAYFGEFMYYLNEKRDSIKASAIIVVMDELFPNSALSLDAHQQIGDNIYGKTFGKEIQTSTKELFQGYQLLGNYPNPFNPTTTISYNLPRMSDVELKIYDLLGNEVKSYFIPSQSAGTQNIFWNGRNNFNEQVTSGIYIYRFRAVSREGKNEVFEKSAKLIMLK